MLEGDSKDVLASHARSSVEEHTIRTPRRTFSLSNTSELLPTVQSNSAANAMAHLEQSSSHLPSIKQLRHNEAVSPSLEPAPTRIYRSTSGFASLAPELRNAIYEMVFDAPLPFFIVAATYTYGQFQLHERSDQSQYDAVLALQALGSVSRELRREARTFFYASKHFLILPYGYEYITVFVRWLEAIGPDCRAALRTVCFAGYLWYHRLTSLTERFHDLLRGCISIRTLTLQINVWHLCASCITDLNTYLNHESDDAPMPRVDISAWVEIILRIRTIEKFRLSIVLSVDSRRATDMEDGSFYFSTENGKALAEHVERSLKEHVDEFGTERNVAVHVRYVGIDRRTYRGMPW
jgi:hypothetical protein